MRFAFKMSEVLPAVSTYTCHDIMECKIPNKKIIRFGTFWLCQNTIVSLSNLALASKLEKIININSVLGRRTLLFAGSPVLFLNCRVSKNG